MRLLIKMVTLLCTALIIIGLVCFFWIGKIEQRVHAPININEEQIFTIAKGSSFTSVLAKLQNEQIISKLNALDVKLIAYLFSEIIEIKEGSYQLLPSMSLYQALDLFYLGKEAVFAITFIEGSRFNDWVEQLKSTPYIVDDISGLSQSELAKLITIDQTLALAANYDASVRLEGLLLADTYHYNANIKASKILALAHQNLHQELEQHWAQKMPDLPLKTPYEALILASIIEKETAIDSERALVASVFINRLNKKMRLQTDPTVIYGMGDKFDGDIRKKDLKTPTAYNTYVIKALPPTPIAMIGKSSLKAALNPIKSDYIYFVADGSGAHIFSKTLKEHNKAVSAYLKKLKLNQ